MNEISRQFIVPDQWAFFALDGMIRFRSTSFRHGKEEWFRLRQLTSFLCVIVKLCRSLVFTPKGHNFLPFYGHRLTPLRPSGQNFSLSVRLFSIDE